MEKITQTQLEFILENKGIVAITNQEKHCIVSRDFWSDTDMILDKQANNQFVLYPATEEGEYESLEELYKAQDKGELFAHLFSEGFIEDASLELLKINFRFKSFVAYLEDYNFQTIQMKDLLLTFPEATVFSLTTPFQKNTVGEDMFGEYTIDAQIFEQAVAKEMQEGILLLEEYYLNFTEEEKQKLPEFSILIDEIKEEARSYHEKVASGLLEEEESPFIHDLFGTGKVKYNAPQSLWHFYYFFSHVWMTYVPMKEALLRNTKKRDIMDVFNNPKYQALQSHLENAEISFRWHATVSMQLYITYFFQINEDTKKWLIEQASPLNMNELEDLALYQENELLFSSCTHEQTLRNCREEGK